MRLINHLGLCTAIRSSHGIRLDNGRLLTSKLFLHYLPVENSGISYSDILILIPDSRTVYDLIFTLFILLTLSR